MIELFNNPRGINFPCHFGQKLGFPHFCAPTAAISKNYPFYFSKEKKSSVLRKERRYEILLRKAAAAKCSQYRLPRRRGEKLHPCARRTAADLRRREPDRFGLQHADRHPHEVYGRGRGNRRAGRQRAPDQRDFKKAARRRRDLHRKRKIFDPPDLRRRGFRHHGPLRRRFSRAARGRGEVRRPDRRKDAQDHDPCIWARCSRYLPRG